MYCQKCGKQNADNATHCTSCGEPLTPANNPTPQMNIQQKTPKKKRHGCLITVLIVAIVFVVVMIALSNNNDDNSTSGTTSTNAPIIADNAETKTGKIGKYNITIKESKVVQNGDKNILIVTYVFTNNSDDSKAFMYAVTDKLFQNGVELGTVYSSWGMEDEYNFDNKSKEIKPGVSLDVQCAYELNDTTTDVEVEITEWISLDDKKLTYVIQLGQ